MKVFISWSGENSKAVANALREWLPFIFPEVAFWASTRDIAAGQRWGDELDRELGSTDFGILCLVPGNIVAPWLIYEAGALSKAISSSRVVPYCLGIEPQQVPEPLSRFNGVSADRDGTYNLVRSIASLVDVKRDAVVLERTFQTFWPDLHRKIAGVQAASNRGPDVVRVQRILCASTPFFEDLGAADDMSVIEASYPGAVTRIHNASLVDLRDALALQKFEIVHLLGYVDPKSGDFVFSEQEKLPARGLLKLLEQSGTSLLFLATCDSLILGAIVSRFVSVIAASDFVEAQSIVAWERCFYGLLAKGMSLAAAYDIAQATADLPMRLLMRHDTRYVPAETGT